MNVAHCPMLMHSCAKYGLTKSKDYKTVARACQKPYKFDLEVTGQLCISIITVRDTFSHGDTPMSQIW